MRRHGRRLTQVLAVGLIGVALAIAVGVVRPAPAYACSCAAAPSPTTTLARSDVAFAGELVRIDRPPFASNSGADQKLRFEVTRVYKGDVDARTTVHTAQSSASCGLGLEQPGPYVIFGSGGGADVNSGLCDGPISGTSVPASFGAGREPTATDAGPWSPVAPNPAVRLIAVLGTVVVLAGAGLAVVLVRRRRRT